MTNEQATKVLKRIQYGTTYPVYEALNMAIETLNFVSEHHQSNIETYAHDMGVSLEQAERELRVEELSCSEEPNRSDLISRTRLLTDLQETVEAWSKYPVMEEEIKGIEVAIAYVKNIPSAQPEKSTTEEKSQLAEEKSTRKLIYLDEAIDVAKQHWYKPDIAKELEKLPSAQPERKKGKWIHKPDIYLDEQTWECSECGEPWIFIEGTPSENNANFCPNCGADMRGEQNGND